MTRPVPAWDVAANPVQYALASLGSCQAITYQFWAEQLGIGFDTLSEIGRAHV